MPPVLGWAAVTNSAPAEAWLLALIIFVWTPPHFWALALYRIDDYRKARLADAAGDARRTADKAPHPPVHDRAGGDHGSALRSADGRCALPRGGAGPRRRLRRLRLAPLSAPNPAVARATFNYSIVYLAALFAALLADHYV